MYLCGPGKHGNCQPFCGPEGRFYCSDSVCSLWPAPFSYLCVSVMILCVLKTVCGWTSKNWLLPYACCGLHFIDSAACVLSFDHSAPLQLWRCEQDERSYPRPQQVAWPRPRPQQTTLMMMASHQHHRRRVPQLTTRLATSTTDDPG